MCNVLGKGLCMVVGNRVDEVEEGGIMGNGNNEEMISE